MSSPVSYLYEPLTNVFVITAPCSASTVMAVEPGVIIRVNIEVLVTGNTIMYDVRVAGQVGTTPLAETSIYADLTTALTAYQLLLS